MLDCLQKDRWSHMVGEVIKACRVEILPLGGTLLFHFPLTELDCGIDLYHASYYDVTTLFSPHRNEDIWPHMLDEVIKACRVEILPLGGTLLFHFPLTELDCGIDLYHASYYDVTTLFSPHRNEDIWPHMLDEVIKACRVEEGSREVSSYLSGVNHQKVASYSNPHMTPRQAVVLSLVTWDSGLTPVSSIH
ncbi:hypothetical protein J6590_039329 [Homalodisca vitripennis]|nr:hypothetical protein J6590_039329 [Homalodisca vitripennis]